MFPYHCVQLLPLPVRPLPVPPEFVIGRTQFGVGVAQFQKVVLEVGNLDKEHSGGFLQLCLYLFHWRFLYAFRGI